MGQHWVKGNGGEAARARRTTRRASRSATSRTSSGSPSTTSPGNRVPGSRLRGLGGLQRLGDQGANGRLARPRADLRTRPSRSRRPSQVSSGATYVYPAIDAAGDVYVAVVSFPPSGKPSRRSTSRARVDDGRSFGRVRPRRRRGILPAAGLPNTRFRDGITESFAASPTYPGHLYLTYEDWDGDADGREVHRSRPTAGAPGRSRSTVNDNVDPAGAPTDQFQPSVAAGPNGAVAVAFYDRRQACPNDPSILPADVGRTNFCIDTTLQAYKDTGCGRACRSAATCGSRSSPGIRSSPDSTSAGSRSMPCAGHRDPCPDGRGFIGDYFGLAISAENIYALFVSTHYPSTRDRRRGRPRLLPAAGAGHGSALDVRSRLLGTNPRPVPGVLALGTRPVLCCVC